MAESIYSTTIISNGGRDGRVFSPTILSYKI